MNPFFFCRRLIVVSFLAAACFALRTPGQNAQPQSPAATSNSPQSAPPSTAADDAAAKAAERKKRFDEAKKRLENSASQQQNGSDAAASCSYSPNDLSLSPALVNIVVGETQRFSLFDQAGHKLTAQADWSVSDSSIAELHVESDGPVLTSKQKGTARVQARVDAHSAEATVNVISAEEMKPGTIRWSAPPTPCAKTKGIVVAVPSGGVR